jgi:ribosomal protein L11 methyltransferase
LSKYSRLTIRRRAKDDVLAGLLWLHEPLGLLEEGTDLVACFRSAPAARRAREEIAARGYRSVLATDIREGDPLEAFRAASRPFAVGEKLWIDPGEPSSTPPPAGRVALRLPASRAFGTGGHESTRLALRALEEEVPEGADVLDAGTGSGILALAAAALGARRAVAFDRDAEAVFVARENARRHPFGARVHLFAGEVDAAAGKYAIVVANMLPEELSPILPALASRVEPRGRLVLSGVPSDREEEILGRSRRRRLHLSSRLRENSWSCLCLSRASS